MSQLSIKIEVHSLDYQLDSELFSRLSLSRGNEVIISDGVKLIYDNTILLFSEDVPSIFQFALNIGKDFPVGVAAGLASTWLYNKLKGRKVTKLMIEKTEVELEENKIKKVIHEKMEMEQ